MGKRSSTLHKAASLLLALLVMPAMQCLAQLNTRKPASNASAPNRQAPLVIKKANGTTKTAYGVLGFDLTDGNMLNGLVSFPFTEGARFSLVKYFGDANHDVTAGAYAERFYYAELTQTDLTTQKMIPVELIRYDIEKDVTESVGELSGYTSHINDMSYDYSTKTMYAISVLNDAYTQLFTIDLNTAESKLVADLDRRFFTLACTYEGQLYGISFEGDFCKIDKTNGNVTVVGATGWHPTYYQSMEFDHSDETLYWAANLMGGTDFDDCIATVDINTGAAQKVAAVGNSPQIAGLYVPFAASAKGTPSAVSDFDCVPGANGATTVALYWMNPTQTFDGKELSSLTDIKVYRDRELIKTFENPEMGEEMSYTDDLGDVKGGYHFYSVVASNSVGEGAEEKVRIFVGRDIPADVTTLTLQHDGYDKAVISWNQPELGPNGGYVDASSLSYKVVRKPDGRVIADGLKQTTVSDENISPVGQYSYSVVASNADGEYADDNTTDYMTVIVREAFDGDVVAIGLESSATASSSPFDLSNQYAAALNIYSADEIGENKDMLIQKLAWTYDALYQYSDVETIPVRIYLANTDLTNTKDGWIPEEQLTLVYDGITSIAQKTTGGDMTIALDEPFKYEAGKNLAVLTAVNCDTYCPYVSFRQYISPLEGNAAYEWGSYYAKQWFDFTQVGHQNYYSRTASIMIYMTDAQTNGITSANTAAVAGTAYTVSDVAGRVVATGVFSEQGTVNTSGLQRGVYVVSYKVDGKRQAMKISVNK